MDDDIQGNYHTADFGDVIPATSFSDIMIRGGNNPDGRFTLLIE
jgi:hypothetical protein